VIDSQHTSSPLFGMANELIIQEYGKSYKYF
jgi:hypothetical protein